MNASFKAAFIILLASTVVVSFEEELKQLKRHAILAPLSDLSVSVDEAERAIAGQMNTILLLPEVHANTDLWKRILLSRAKYPFEQDETGLNAALLEQKLTALLESFLNDLDSAPAGSRNQAFEDGLAALEERSRRLVKFELIQQLFSILEHSKEEIVFRGDVIVHVINLALPKLAQMDSDADFNGGNSFKRLEQRLQSLKQDLEAHFFQQARSLLDLLGNPAYFLDQEVRALFFEAQSLSLGKDALDTLPLKFGAGFDMFAQARVTRGEQAEVEKFFSVFKSVLVMAAKAGSKMGTFNFKRLVPEITGHAIRVIGQYVSLERGFQVAREYLRSIAPANIERPSVMEFMGQYLASGNLPWVTSGTNFAAQSLKVADIVKRMPFKQINQEWWRQTLGSLHLIFKTVSADLLGSLEKSKDMACNYASSFVQNPEYYLGLYDLLAEAVVELGVEMSGQDWVFSFLDFVQDRYETAGPNAHTPEGKYLRKYYLLVVINALAYRPIDNNEGDFDFQAFDLDLFKGITLYEKFGSDETFRQNLLKALAAKAREDKSLGFSDVKLNLNFLLQMSGRSIPLSFFKILPREDKETREIVTNDGYENKRQGFKFRVKTSQVKELEKPVGNVTPVTPNVPVTEGKITSPIKVEQPTIVEPPKKSEDDGKENRIDINEEKIPGSPIKETPEGFNFGGDHSQLTTEERDNLIEVVKGSLDEDTIREFQKNRDLIDLVTRIEIKIDPETGDETHYYYVQLVETGTACHDAITDALE